MTYKDIANRLGIALETVKRHLANVKDKTGMTTCLELAVRHYSNEVSMKNVTLPEAR